MTVMTCSVTRDSDIVSEYKQMYSSEFRGIVVSFVRGFSFGLVIHGCTLCKSRYVLLLNVSNLRTCFLTVMPMMSDGLFGSTKLLRNWFMETGVVTNVPDCLSL